ncbi:MAG: TonB-dependent receptor [Pseudomonadota bacterium]
MKRSIRTNVVRSLLAAASVISVAAATTPAGAQSATVQQIEISARPLSEALVAIGRAYGVTVIASDDVTAGKTAPPVSGAMTAEQALAQALAGSGLRAARAANGAYVIAARVVEPASIETPEAVGRQVQDTILVTAGRRRQNINEIARAVVVIDFDNVRTEAAKSSSIFNLVGATIPALGPPTQNNINRAQTLRGRDAQYLIDGVPLGFNGGAGSGLGELDKFDVEIIERIEVLYGPNAVYGAGATGGVIQFFTRAPSQEPFEFRVRQQFSTFLGADDIFGDIARSNKTTVGASGTLGRFDYLLNASFDSNNGVIDGEDDLRAPVFSSFDNELSYFAKVGFTIDSDQRIEGFYNFVDLSFDDRVFDVSITDDGRAVGQLSDNQVAFTYGADNEPINEKRAWNFRYTHDNLLGGAFAFQYYGRDEDIIEPLTDLRALAFAPPFPDNFQAFFTDKGEGVRTQYSRSFLDRFNILFGVDYNEESRSSDARVYELGPDFDDERSVTNAVREDTFLFPYALETLGLFGQVDIAVTDRIRLTGGVRWEDVEFEIGSGTRVFEVVTDANGDQIERQGGFGENDGVAWNIGATIDVSEDVTVFGSFAQGFEIPSLLSLSFLVPAGEPLATSAAAAPQIVDNYEIGLRGAAGIWDYSASAYFASSELGATFLLAQGSTQGEFIRAPQENYGFETSIGVEPTERFRLSGAFSWNDGDFDGDDDGNFDALSGLEVAPWKLIVDARFDATDDLSFNGKILTIGGRDRAFDDGVDPAPVDGYTTVDIGGVYETGPGVLTVQLTNVFNNTYIPTANQTFAGTGFVDRVVAGPGRQLIAAYAFNF